MKKFLLFLIMGSMSAMDLYVRNTCPYCIKVQNKLNELGYIEGQDINILDINDPKNLKKLLEIGKKKQVPCLVENQVATYESDDIIKLLVDKRK